MISIGVDAHKSLHVAVAVNEAGQVLAQWRGANDAGGWAEVQEWAQALGAERQWGIEGAWNYGRGLAQQLVAAGEVVYEVNARWTARGRSQALKRGKTDERDAQAIALVVRREDVRLPRVAPEDAAAVLEVLTTQRDAALAEATRLRNQAHQLLLQCDPQYRQHLPALTTEAGVAALVAYTAPRADAVSTARAATLQMLGQRLQLAVQQAATLEEQIVTRARAGFSPLIRLKGINALTAGALAGLLGPGQRFRNDGDVAAYAGVAPLEASSAGRVRHRLNRGGNRRLNALIHRIAVTQMRCWPPAQQYVARRLSEGKTKREAIRALKRYIARAIWQLWRECERLEQRPLDARAA